MASSGSASSTRREVNTRSPSSCAAADVPCSKGEACVVSMIAFLIIYMYAFMTAKYNLMITHQGCRSEKVVKTRQSSTLFSEYLILATDQKRDCEGHQLLSFSHH